MVKKKETRFDRIKVGELQEIHEMLSDAAENLGALIKQMKKEDAEVILLRLRTQRKSAEVWRAYSLGLAQAYANSKIRLREEEAGKFARIEDMKNKSKN